MIGKLSQTSSPVMNGTCAQGSLRKIDSQCITQILSDIY